MLRLPLLVVLNVLMNLAWAASLGAMDRVTLRRDGSQIEVEGRTLVTAGDGGLLVLGRDGVLWAVQPEELVKKEDDAKPFAPYPPDELGAKVLAELPPGFAVHKTAHYVICYDTSRAYAQWCGWLFERLYMAFTNYWSRKGFELHDPEFHLTAIVFANRRSYERYSRPLLGDAARAVAGYFDQQSNRMVMHDLTGIEAVGGGAAGGARIGRSEQINRILALPGAEQAVSTVVHEATHQIAYNCGLHHRFSDCPLWVSEGIAVYFETPDLKSRTGWSNIGGINWERLKRFRRYLARRPPRSLPALVRDDTRFRDVRTALDAYAEAWALTYFLLRQHPDEYVAYLGALSKKEPLGVDTPEERLAAFQKAFGDMAKLDQEFLRYMATVR